MSFGRGLQPLFPGTASTRGLSNLQLLAFNPN